MKGIILTEFIKKYWLEFFFGVLCTGCGALWNKVRKQKKEHECLKSALRALLRDRIIGIYNRYSEKEYFPIYERENLEHLTTEYYALGGNGVVHELAARLSEMPTETGKNSRD